MSADVVISSGRRAVDHVGSFRAEIFRTCLRAALDYCLEKTPTICRLTFARVRQGPSRLKIVRVPSSTRVGPTFFMAGWCDGANINLMPAWRSIQCAIASEVRSIFTPRRENVRRRSATTGAMPCFATGTPAPATTKAAHVEYYRARRVRRGADDIDRAGRSLDVHPFWRAWRRPRR